MERDRYTLSDWMLVALMGTLMLERLAPQSGASLSLVIGGFAVLGRLSTFLLQFTPLRSPWIYIAPALIIGAVFHFGLDGLMYYIKHTAITEEALCPKVLKDRNAPQTPLPGPSELVELRLAMK
jgi:hypothetical protein